MGAKLISTRNWPILTHILMNLMVIFSTNKDKFLRHIYTEFLRRVPSQHGEVSAMGSVACHLETIQKSNRLRMFSRNNYREIRCFSVHKSSPWVPKMFFMHIVAAHFSNSINVIIEPRRVKTYVCLMRIRKAQRLCCSLPGWSNT